MERVARSLFEEEERRERFLETLLEGRSGRPALIWMKPRPAEHPFPAVAGEVEGFPEFIDLLPQGSKPGRHPLHQSGSYYCLDHSSVLEAMTLSALSAPVETVVDVCASPGGKSAFAARLLSPGTLLANETIGKRVGALLSNLKRLGVPGVMITSVDASVLAIHARASADLVLVDAPCSGQSLPLKGKESFGAFHPSTINLNSNRQKRIIANASETVAPNGCLAYMTCTYSREENEGVIEWFLERFPHFSAVAAPSLERFRSTLTDLPVYRFWPFEGSGAGGFSALLRRDGEGERSSIDREALRILWESEKG